jgi:hypothetical protein
MSQRLLRKYVVEVLTGFRSLSSTGPDRALGNLRYGDHTLSQKNRSLDDDVEDEEARERQDAERREERTWV